MRTRRLLHAAMSHARGIRTAGKQGTRGHAARGAMARPAGRRVNHEAGTLPPPVLTPPGE
jgi:hypothetical protein